MENQTETTEEVKEVTTTNMVDDAVNAADRLEAMAKRLEEANAETARLQARAALGGRAEAGAQAPAPVKLTDIEFANKVKNGEINPLKADGYL